MQESAAGSRGPLTSNGHFQEDMFGQQGEIHRCSTELNIVGSRSKGGRAVGSGAAGAAWAARLFVPIFFPYGL